MTLFERLLGMKRLIAGRLFNSALFYLAWIVCIHQATGPRPYTGPLVIAVLLIIHFYYTKERLLEAILIPAIALFGTIWDSLYIHLGWIDYVGGYENFPGVIPLWMTSLWAFYATTINHSLAWVYRKFWFMAILGGLGAAVSYAVAFKLGAAILHVSQPFMLTVIGCVWALVFPFSFYLNDWLKKKLRSTG